MPRRSPPRKITYFEPVPPRLARNTIIESTFEVGRRFRCTMRIDCGQLDPGAVIRPEPGEWHPRMPRAPRRGGAGGLARRPQRSLSARRAGDRLAASGRRRVSPEPQGVSLQRGGGMAGTERRVRQIENPGRGGRGFRGDEQGGKTRSSSQCLTAPLDDRPG